MNQRNCLILGSGRSGTSMAAGILARAGYFMGAELWPADIGNPKGYFEDREVNKINDELIAPAAPKTPPHGLRKLLLGDIPILGNYQHWVAVLRPGVSISCPPAMSRRIAAVAARQPFCLKDPRFSYTLSAWRPFIGDALLLCVFRDPAVTASSIVRECKRADHMQGTEVDQRWALKVWEAMYRYILDVHYRAGRRLDVRPLRPIARPRCGRGTGAPAGNRDRPRIRRCRTQSLAAGRRGAAPDAPALRAAVRARSLRHGPPRRDHRIGPGRRSMFSGFFPTLSACACRSAIAKTAA